MKTKKKRLAVAVNEVAEPLELAGPPSDTLGPLEPIVCQVRARLVGELDWWIDSYVDASWPSEKGDVKDYLEEMLRRKIGSACIDVMYLARRVTKLRPGARFPLVNVESTKEE